VDEINEEYRKDLGTNRGLHRYANFSKKFKWFTTNFRYSETIERSLTIDCPISDFISDDVLHYFYLPGTVQADLRNGTESLRIIEMENIINEEVMHWFFTSEIRQWIEIFYTLYENSPDLTMNREQMNSLEWQFVKHLIDDDSDRAPDEYISDSLFTSVLLHEMDRSCLSASDYDMEIRMPGKIIASNGYAETEPGIDNKGGILWSVDPAYFLTQTYEMWVESKVNNYAVWIISALFILFVITGFVIFLRRVR
jgi:hypothetical protein